MSYNIEFLGPPGSGKSYIFEKLIDDLKKIKIIIKKPKDTIILDYLKTKTDISYARKLGYYFYFKNVKIDSKKIFNKEYKNFSNYLNSYIKKDLKIKSISKIYNKYLSTTNYSFERKKRTGRASKPRKSSSALATRSRSQTSSPERRGFAPAATLRSSGDSSSGGCETKAPVRGGSRHDDWLPEVRPPPRMLA